MKQSYQQIASQIASLQRQAEVLRSKEIAVVVARIKEAINVYGLTAIDLGLGATSAYKIPKSRKVVAGPRPASTGKKVAVKYRDSAGNTWTGRGSRPRWLAAALEEGKKIEDFAISRRAKRP